ncbi:F-box protein At3g54460 [Phalaenopsis equestris]|uniref:F-box protein At3g54460 n=1 Tax=Phalaenopsis equestris TaxID=78828 RepID=UPI0009E355BE|nr:F-box protein At3g54460 [Phalaenopsis equestris]XP_020598805.1 F-box protein At3g54460 [Phalaenopsis equestris]
MADSELDDSISGYKLCGFLRVVLAVAQQSRALPSCVPCSLFADGSNVGFRTYDGILLFPVSEVNAPQEMGREESSAWNVGGCTGAGLKRKRRGLGGCRSIVHLLQMLTAKKCVNIQARVLKVSSREFGDARALILVDVYLPIDVWSGWQFPKSGALAASLFKHVSCNWEARSPLLSSNHNNRDYPDADDEGIWSISNCHVFGCETHNASSSGRNRSFDLHEIFKCLPSAGRDNMIPNTRMEPENTSARPGIWDLTDDVLYKVLSLLHPIDVVRISATCHHLRCLASSITPCMKLKLFPHQEAAVEWMLERERKPEFMSHPLYMRFSTVDGFLFYINAVSGEISTGAAPTISDFRGGLFCDEPGLGKTVTALSLILKTHGTLADPPDGVDVRWCMHKLDRRCGYYELGSNNLTTTYLQSAWKRFIDRNCQKGKDCSSKLSSDLGSSATTMPPSLKQGRPLHCEISIASKAASVMKLSTSSSSTYSTQLKCAARSTRSLNLLKRDLMDTYQKNADVDQNKNGMDNLISSIDIKNVTRVQSITDQDALLTTSNKKHKRDNIPDSGETWVQCDACRKWRKLTNRQYLDTKAAWFCSMNIDPSHQSCAVPEESWDYKRKITYLPGFYTKGNKPGKEENILFFTSVLNDHLMLLDSKAKKALTWLANLSTYQLLKMENVGITSPFVDYSTVFGKQSYSYHAIFQAFGLVAKPHRQQTKWFYPRTLENLIFDSTALKTALTKPLDLCRLYLSGATLIVVPANLVEHWKTQIEKHVSPGQLHVYVWNDNSKPGAHNLAWDYDVVITTFNRFSSEWSPHKKSVLMQVHWLRVILDEGHTLGSSLSLTNKFQMSISLHASNRWILTGTPTPNTPSSQVAQLHPMLKFLHEEAYGLDHKSWEAAILRPFEAYMVEGRACLLQLLKRIMISARKIDLKSIPPCIKKVTFLDFTAEHSKSYNELVLTVRRNILMADWNDPSHVESLLNPKQWKFRSSTIKNVRLSCCVAGHIKVTDAGQDIQETMDILVQQGLDPFSEDYVFIKIALLDGCSCFRCKDWCRLPIITPCRHLLCLDCVALDSEQCTYPGCNYRYEMQSPEVLKRPENPNPKWPVPKDLIELQPSYKQDDWDPDWESTSSSKVAYLINKLKDLLDSNLQMHCCVDRIYNNETLASPPNTHSEVSTHQEITRRNCDSHKALPLKVIVFSQFLEHIHVIEQQLTIAGIIYGKMYSPLHSFNKMKSLKMFQYDANCTVLLMDGSAALGLDLSFVTHVFLMEPIWDRSMEEQVISRAHRMGATRPIHVETLAMRGTIEEQMLDFLQGDSPSWTVLGQDILTARRDCTRAARTFHDFAESNYLAHLNFVRTPVKI